MATMANIATSAVVGHVAKCQKAQTLRQRRGWIGSGQSTVVVL
jgi:hypothetical protein